MDEEELVEILEDPEFVDEMLGALELDIDMLLVGLPERVRLREGLRLTAVDFDVDVVMEAIDDTVLAILADALTEPDEEGVLLDDVEGDTDRLTETEGDTVWTADELGVPEAGIVATSNPIEAGGIHNHNGAVGSLHGSAYTPN